MEENNKVTKTAGFISASLFNKRISMGINRQEFAEYLGTTQKMVSRWESAEYDFPISVLIDIYGKLEMTFSIVVDGVSA